MKFWENAFWTPRWSRTSPAGPPGRPGWLALPGWPVGRLAGQAGVLAGQEWPQKEECRPQPASLPGCLPSVGLSVCFSICCLSVPMSFQNASSQTLRVSTGGGLNEAEFRLIQPDWRGMTGFPIRLIQAEFSLNSASLARRCGGTPSGSVQLNEAEFSLIGMACREAQVCGIPLEGCRSQST